MPQHKVAIRQTAERVQIPDTCAAASTGEQYCDPSPSSEYVSIAYLGKAIEDLRSEIRGSQEDSLIRLVQAESQCEQLLRETARVDLQSKKIEAELMAHKE